MPSNTVVINGVDEYYVGDSKMDKLIKFLNKHGTREPEKEKEKELTFEEAADFKREQVDFSNPNF